MKLHTLDIRNNGISTLPTSMIKLYETLTCFYFTGNSFIQPLQKILYDYPHFVALYYLQCSVEGKEFILEHAPIPKYIWSEYAFNLQLYLTNTPSMDIPLHFFRCQFTTEPKFKLDSYTTVYLNASFIVAESQTHRNRKFWEKADGVVIFAKKDKKEVKQFLNKLRPQLHDNTKIMLVLVCSEKEELDGASAHWDLDKEKQIIVRTEVWLEKYDFSTNADSFQNLFMQSNISETMVPACEKFKNQLLRSIFDPHTRFLSLFPNAQKEIRGKEETRHCSVC